MMASVGVEEGSHRSSCPGPPSKLTRFRDREAGASIYLKRRSG